MELLLLLGLCAPNIGLAMFTFLVVARPERALVQAAWVSGLSQELRQGDLTAEEEVRLEGVARRLGVGLLGLLLIWSFATGVLMTRLRLGI